MSKKTRPVGITTPEGAFILLLGHPRLAKFRVEAIKLVLAGNNIREAAEIIAPTWTGSCFNEWSHDQKEEKIRAIRKDIRNLLQKLTYEEMTLILNS